LAGAVFFPSDANATALEPALWKIEKDGSTVYLFGSIHVLPRGVAWRTPAIDKAIASSSIFAFEAPLTEGSMDRIRRYARENGTLPRGKTILRQLSPDGQKDFKALLSRSVAEPGLVNVMKPWLALFTLESTVVARGGGVQGLSPFQGVDLLLQQEADKKKIPKRYLETPQEQMAMIAASMPDDDIAHFEYELHKMNTSQSETAALIADWSHGNTSAIAKLTAESEAGFPLQKQTILDRRNRNWLPKVEAMLTEKKTIFVAVGAAHLTGKASLVDLLCGEGWKVQRIKTGPTAPPAACPVEAGKTLASALRR
jgi:uncharacterized protein YbaP (TraB family)